MKASDAPWQMFRNRVEQAKALEDPMLMLKIQNGMVKDQFDMKMDPMTQKVIGISQQLHVSRQIRRGPRDGYREYATRVAEYSLHLGMPISLILFPIEWLGVGTLDAFCAYLAPHIKK